MLLKEKTKKKKIEKEIYMKYTPRTEIESLQIKEFFELLDYIKRKSKSNYL